MKGKGIIKNEGTAKSFIINHDDLNYNTELEATINNKIIKNVEISNDEIGKWVYKEIDNDKIAEIEVFIAELTRCIVGVESVPEARLVKDSHNNKACGILSAKFQQAVGIEEYLNGNEKQNLHNIAKKLVTHKFPEIVTAAFYTEEVDLNGGNILVADGEDELYLKRIDFDQSLVSITAPLRTGIKSSSIFGDYCHGVAANRAMLLTKKNIDGLPHLSEAKPHSWITAGESHECMPITITSINHREFAKAKRRCLLKIILLEEDYEPILDLCISEAKLREQIKNHLQIRRQLLTFILLQSKSFREYFQENGKVALEIIKQEFNNYNEYLTEFAEFGGTAIDIDEITNRYQNFAERVEKFALTEKDEIFEYFNVMSKHLKEFDVHRHPVLDFLFFNSHTKGWRKRCQELRTIAKSLLFTCVDNIDDKQEKLTVLGLARRHEIFNLHRNNHYVTGAFGRTSAVRAIDVEISQINDPSIPTASPSIQSHS